MGLGERIKDMRTNKGITRIDLAIATGISYHALSKYETNERQPDFETIKAIANYFGISTDVLLYDPEELKEIEATRKANEEMDKDNPDIEGSKMFAKNLKALREIKGISQKELALALSLSPSTIGMYEQGSREPDQQKLGEIADYFCVTTDYLLGRTSPKVEVQIHESPGEYGGFDFSDPSEIDSAILKMKAALQIAVDSGKKTEEEAKEILETFQKQLNIMLNSKK